ncbi:MAG TPA: ABC transporter ATP-binding protein [Acidimicrobiales bacterium]|nr:ABC transporter ATP-binding protein [Acidimicrobiales bacterium]
MTVPTAGPPDPVAAPSPALAVAGLTVRIATRRGVARVVEDVSWAVAPGETLAIVGESGSGKSVSVLSLLGLVPRPPAAVSGHVHFGGRDLLALSEAALEKVRGPGIGVVFQDPMTSLNPVLTVGRQLTEGMEVHLGLGRRAATDRAAELLDMVGIPSPRDRLHAYPHQLSGGMRQRVMIAIALSCEPSVLIADEATTALDVTVQAQIVDLIADLRRRTGLAVVWITHDLGVVAGIADRVAVMYAGRVVEEGHVDDVYADPRHPYTQGLLASLPVLGRRRVDLPTIAGLPPDPVAIPPGCAFHPRCPWRGDARCATEVPPLRVVAGGGGGSRPPGGPHPLGTGDARDGAGGPPAGPPRGGRGDHRFASFYDVPAREGR